MKAASGSGCGGSRSAQINPRRLVFLGRKRRDHRDDSSLWACRTWRARLRRCTRRHWRTITLLGTITLDGVLPTMTIESPTDGDVCLAYLEQVLCPRLLPGQIVVMDNLSAHKHARVRLLIEQSGARCSICHPTRPTSIPSRSAGPKSKNTCGAPKRECYDVLEQSITTAIACVTAENSAAWFQHCGYRIQLP